MNDRDKQMTDIIKIDDIKLSLSEIESIASDTQVRKRYENRYPFAMYSIVLRSLTHEFFEEKEAQTLWVAILEHRQRLNTVLNRDVGIAVASMDYLMNISKKLDDPIIIEEEKSSFVTTTSTKDDLTGLYTRDVFDVVLEKEVNRSLRKNRPLVLLMIDIDDFKKINDAHGHQKGDEALKSVGTILNHSIRAMDLAARYGGEEFAVVMPNTNIQFANQIAERVRGNIERSAFDRFNVTVSIGVGQINGSVRTVAKLIDAADMALYSAKKAGKNTVRVRW
jgi:diguanylate cyclase (GGDEF)-like protein